MADTTYDMAVGPTVTKGQKAIWIKQSKFTLENLSLRLSKGGSQLSTCPQVGNLDVTQRSSVK